VVPAPGDRRVSIAGLPSAIDLAERGLVPDPVLRLAIRRQCERHAARLAALAPEQAEREIAAFLAAARRGPVALTPERANLQHYEVPPEFFAEVLGPRRKYSACWWERGVVDLKEAEEAALRITCARAELRDGQRVLELGCGWGSLTLWMAERYPASRIVAISNSGSQRAHIESEVKRRGLRNVAVKTLDMNDFRPASRFDRVVSVEMFEHMRNWEELLRRVADCLDTDARVFLHVFCHRRAAYAYESEGEENWLARHFFTGGMMPSRDYLRRLDVPLEVEAEWTWDGTHYQKTANAWLANLDRRRDAVRAVLAARHGAADAARRLGRWRMFFLACAEMFGLRGGSEWMVGHYRLAPRSGAHAAR